jgi:hypothetical protein
VGGGLNRHFKDSRQHPAQDRACCTHTKGIPDFKFPICSESGNPPSPDSGRIGNRGFPPRFPAKSGIGGTGTGDFRARVSVGPGGALRRFKLLATGKHSAPARSPYLGPGQRAQSQWQRIGHGQSLSQWRWAALCDSEGCTTKRWALLKLSSSARPAYVENSDGAPHAAHEPNSKEL